MCIIEYTIHWMYMYVCDPTVEDKCLGDLSL